MTKGRQRMERGVTVLFMTGGLMTQRTLLHAALAPEKKFDPSTDCVENVTLNRDTYQSQVKPFWGSWSTDFLHSTDIVLATGKVLDKVLGSQEDRITTVDSVRFHQRLHAGLETYTKILAPHEELNNLFIPERGKPTYTFKAATQNGKKIGLVGYDSGAAIGRERYWENCNMSTIFSRLYEVEGARRTDFRCSFRLPITPSANQGVDYSNPVYATTVAMDTVMGFRQALEAINYLPKMGAALAAGFESMDVPPVSFFTATGGVLELDVDFERLKVGNNFAILPIAFDYQHFDGTKCGGGTYNIAIPKTEYVVSTTQALMQRMGRF